MKNLFITSAFLVLLFASCDSNDSDNNNSTDTPELTLVTSSNTSGKITYTDLLAAAPMVKSFTIASLDAEGISYNSETDAVIVASRTNNKLETYTGIKSALKAGTDNLTLSISSLTGEFTNARETAVSGDIVVVAQDQLASNGMINKFFVYKKTAANFSLVKTFTTDFKLWGIHINGNDLYAVADLTGDLVFFKDFMNNASGTITATKRVTIAGLTRSHGITYSSSDDVMILTDVASATSGTDGGLIVIKNFSTVFNATMTGGTIALMNQIRVYGPNSTLGNPVDVAYDTVTKKIYVAERLNAGGQVLTFNYPTMTGDFAPVNVRAEAGVTSVFILRK
ncbi:hypothetical protein D0809_17320 [Flavobacterium circumlabens]|uniref:Uncharacterized protein n=1 Tax=Flavobacterium circumlabens TaxID=2133765 RepID=A0A4Y7UAX1_9FLAO|nr:hypothetical protein [Flavobacterium circumlabens]TCN55392.1 hypothetical protein EV142_10680 [Flavobacterium circumlabens]TEB43188.1 hypothetical protein D0809_17320 [Flavobacterium circumlabens]